MEKIIYIQLLNEGTRVFRPAPAEEVETNVYRVGGHDIFDIETEEWEFTPGSLVLVEEQELSDGKCLVAVKLLE